MTADPWRLAHLGLLLPVGGWLRLSTDAQPRRRLLQAAFVEHARLHGQPGIGWRLPLAAWADAAWPELDRTGRAERTLAEALGLCTAAGLDREAIAALSSRELLATAARAVRQ